MKINHLLSDIENQVVTVKTSELTLKRSTSTRNRRSHDCLMSENSEIRTLDNFLNADIKGLSLNSKMVKKGYLFFCLSGTQYKGSDFINEAYQKGTRVVITQDKINVDPPEDLIIVRVKDILKCLGEIANSFYGHPLDKLNLTAVTGTNGKTTTTFIIESILKAFKKDVGIIGTVNYRFSRSVFNAINTTPDILTTYNFIHQMLEDKIKYLVMEVSSHALSQGRIEGLKFNQAIFTNLSQDHFDYHKTKINYFMVKSILFRKYLKEDGIAIVNIDDDYGLKLINLIKNGTKRRILTYAIKKEADICANNIVCNSNGCCFTVQGLKHKFKADTNLLGIFNIYNVLAAIAACLNMNIPQEYILKGIKEIYLPGRMERIVSNRNFKIFIDYAHTEAALKNVLSALVKLKGRGKLIVVFGCGGDRDRDKRPKMGRVASELADFVIITSDNPRFENPERIISDIKKGIIKNNYITLIDRKEAIKKAVCIARSQDIIVVAGKGHENYQIIKDKKFAFNDRSVTEEILSLEGIC